jgi:hypothetical protein
MNNAVLRGLCALLLLSLSACASQVTRMDPPNTQREPIKALASFDVGMSANSSAQLADNLKFDVEVLRAMLQRTLESKQLLAADGDFEMKVVVDDIRVRSTFNAVFWGFMAGDDHLAGTVTLQRRDGSAVTSFGVKASWALGGLAGGQDASRIGWLYEEFSKKVAEELAERRDGKR